MVSAVIKNTMLREKVRFWHLPELGNAELMRATYVNRSFPRHTHEGFGIGVIERGVLEFYYRGKNVVASPGVINLVNPDEVHTGHAATEKGWTYRMFYFGAELLQKAASEIACREVNVPFFQDGVIHDEYLAAMIRSLHGDLEENKTPLLEKESRFLLMLAQLIVRHADAPPFLQKVGHEHHSVKQAKEFIGAHYDENISIEQLSSIANLSPFHFIRVFHSHVGMPPHAYLTQIRVSEAKSLLKKGKTIADTAYKTGFVDQSHFSKCFKRMMGFTPGQYSNFIQDS